MRAIQVMKREVRHLNNCEVQFLKTISFTVWLIFFLQVFFAFNFSAFFVCLFVFFKLNLQMQKKTSFEDYQIKIISFFEEQEEKTTYFR